MTALVAGLVHAEQTIRPTASSLTATLDGLDLDTSEIIPCQQTAGWVTDALVPTRRRLAMAQALVAATPGGGTFVQFDESVLSTRTPAEAVKDARTVALLMAEDKTAEVLRVVAAEGYDPYFARALAQYASWPEVERFIVDNYTDRYGDGGLARGVDPKQYEAMLTGLGQTFSLASRGTGDLDLGRRWRSDFLAYLTAGVNDRLPNGTYANTATVAGRSALLLLLAHGVWSTQFLQEAAARIRAVDDPAFWTEGAAGAAVTPTGVPYTDPAVALLTALTRNPEAATSLFTEGATTGMPIDGGQVPVNGFLHWALLDHDYAESGYGDGTAGAAVAVLALRAAVGGDKYSPVALDVRTVQTSAAQQQTAWERQPWYQKWGHTILGLIEMFPVVGSSAAIPDAAWYAVQGDLADAGLTAAGALPLVGGAAVAGHFLVTSGKALDAVKTLRLVDLSGKEIVDGLDSAELLKTATAIEPGVFRFDNAADFRAAMQAPHPNVTYEYAGIRYTTDTTASIETLAPEVAGKTVPEVMKGWTKRTADNGKGTVWQEPGATGNANSVRVMGPNVRYPDGYVRFYNEHGQPIGRDGKPGSNAATHIPRRVDGTYPIPKGWHQ